MAEGGRDCTKSGSCAFQFSWVPPARMSAACSSPSVEQPGDLSFHNRGGLPLPLSLPSEPPLRRRGPGHAPLHHSQWGKSVSSSSARVPPECRGGGCRGSCPEGPSRKHEGAHTWGGELPDERWAVGRRQTIAHLSFLQQVVLRCSGPSSLSML